MPSKTQRSSRAAFKRLARERFGYDDLRPGQEEVIQLIMEGRDVLSIMPTGAGKSAIYQMCGLLLDGPTIVISPLIALQKDQVDSIDDKNLPEAAVVNSTQRVAERRDVFEKLEGGELEFLFLSPEQLTNEETFATVRSSPPEQSDLPFPLKSRVSHRKFGEGVVMRYDSDKIIVQFDTEGEKAMVTKVVLDNRLMRVQDSTSDERHRR